MQLFSEQGFDGTSTRAIAEAAGVNEALIFRHFRSKEDLFWSVLSDMSSAGVAHVGFASSSNPIRMLARCWWELPKTYWSAQAMTPR